MKSVLIPRHNNLGLDKPTRIGLINVQRSFRVVKNLATLAILSLSALTVSAADENLVARLKSPDPSIRCNAAKAVSEAPEISDDLLPVLFEVFLAPRTGTLKEQLVEGVAIHYAELSIARYGVTSIPRLRELVRNRETRWKAIGVINRIGSDAEAAIPEIVTCISDPNENVRSLAIRTVYKLGAKGSAAIDALIVAADDPKEENREAAIQAIGEIGPAAKKAIPVLKTRIHSKDVMVPHYAKEALEKIEK